MNDLTIPEYNRGLEDVTRDIRIKTGQFLMDAIEIGRLLFEAKAMVEPGGWSKYIEEQLPFSHSWANNYMKLYKELGTEQLTLFGNSQAIMNLRPTHALEILKLPAEEREEFMQTHDVENMSSRQLQQAIKEKEEAEKAMQKAREDALALAQEKNDLEMELDNVTRSRDAAIREKKDAQEKAEDFKEAIHRVKAEAERAEKSEKNALEQVEKLNKDLEKAQAAEKKAKEDLKKLQDSPQVPDAVMEQLRKDAEAQAAEEVTAEIRKQLAVAKQEAEDAAKARSAAEARLAEAKKSAKLSNPDMMAVNVLGKKMLSDWNTILGHRKKAVAADESYDAPLRAFLEKMLETMRSGMEGV